MVALPPQEADKPENPDRPGQKTLTDPASPD